MIRAHARFRSAETCVWKCVCTMAWRFYAIDATLSPYVRLHDGVISAQTRDARQVLLIRVVVVRHRSQIETFHVEADDPVPEARVLVQVVVPVCDPREPPRHRADGLHNVTSMAWKKQMQFWGQRRVDGVGRLKFDSHTGRHSGAGGLLKNRATS